MSLDYELGHPLTLAEARFAHSRAFLETRDTDFEKMLGVVAREVEGLEHMLLTSSAVHGLANATSDIDTICVVDGPDLKARTATQFFDGGNHFETIIFSNAEVARELARLRQAADGTAAKAYAAYKSWNKHGPMNRKYLERLVNGVTAQGTSPFLAHLETLAPLWRAASLGQAIMAVSCMGLATKARRGPAAIGYAVNAVLFMMDALMSHHAQVYSNKKWYRLRFSRFAEEKSYAEDFGPIVLRLNAFWDRLLLALRDGGAPETMFAEIRDVVSEIDTLMKTDMRTGAVWNVPESATTKPFLTGAFANVTAAKEVQFLGARLEPISIGQEHDLTPDEAQNAIRAIRGATMAIAFSDAKV